jgi:23S rRNA (guanosine2251-2'-O)-methyltransferase
MPDSSFDSRDLIWGRHPVEEALRVPGRVRRVLVAQGARDHGVSVALELATAAHVHIERVPREQLERLAAGANHQGIIAVVAPWEYASVADLLAIAEARDEPPLLLALDSVQDVQNLGSLIRTAEAVGAHGVIVPEHRAAGVTPAVVKSSAGAIEHLPVAQVTNLTRTLDDLKSRDIWVYGLAGDATQTLETVDLDRALALVVGAEGKGLSRLVREHCDVLVSLPMRGQVNSLNAAVAGSIALYAAWRARVRR